MTNHSNGVEYLYRLQGAKSLVAAKVSQPIQSAKSRSIGNDLVQKLRVAGTDTDSSRLYLSCMKLLIEYALRDKRDFQCTDNQANKQHIPGPCLAVDNNTSIGM